MEGAPVIRFPAIAGLPAAAAVRHTRLMKRIGKRRIAGPATAPSAAALRAAAIHQASGQAIAAVATTGIPKGIYRFASHEEMNRHTEEALARAIALNVRRRGAQETLERALAESKRAD